MTDADTSGDPHIEAVAAKMRERSKLGLSKYGVDLTRTDLSRQDWLTHLQEELMDGAAYVERLLSENTAAQSRIAELEDVCDTLRMENRTMSLDIEAFKKDARDPTMMYSHMAENVFAKPAIDDIIKLYGEDAIRQALSTGGA